MLFRRSEQEIQAGRRVHGLCRCGAEASPGRRTCAPCRENDTRIKADEYAARKAAGLCPSCGKRAPAHSREWCQECIEKQRAKNRRRRRVAGKDPAVQGCAYCQEPGHNAIACHHLRQWTAQSRVSLPRGRYAGRGKMVEQIVMVARLLTVAPLTATEMGRQAGLTWRTAYRMIEQLAEAGMPIDEAGKDERGAQRYRIRPRALLKFFWPMGSPAR